MTKPEDFSLDTEDEDDDEEWEGEVDWSTESAEEGEDVKDEGAEYLDFLNKEVSASTVQVKLDDLDSPRSRPKSIRSEAVVLILMTIWKKRAC